MTIHIVACFPFSDNVVGDGVEARYLETAHQYLPIVMSQEGEWIVIPTDSEGIEKRKYHKGYGSRQAFLSAQAEHAKQVACAIGL